MASQTNSVYAASVYRPAAKGPVAIRHPDSAAKAIEAFSQEMSKPASLKRVSDQYHEICKADQKLATKAMTVNKAANRYMDVKCYDATRVVLKPELPNHPMEYIHANWVDGYDTKRQFIGCQGPTTNTVGEFWRMIWQTETVVIVSLTKLGGPRCMLYFPATQSASEQYANIRVTNRGVVHKDNFEAVSLHVTKDQIRRRCLHLTYYAWPDKGTPDSSTSLLAFVDNINFNAQELIKDAVSQQNMTADVTHPIVVHCSAGVGRTGTLIALHIACRQLDVTFGRNRKGLLDLEGIVRQLRIQRHMMVQRAEQYVFLHMAVLDYALRKKYLLPAQVNVRSFFKDVGTMARADLKDN